MLFENLPPAGAGLACSPRLARQCSCFRAVDNTPGLTCLTGDEYLRESKRKDSHREKFHIPTCLKCPRMNWIFISANKWGQLLKKSRPPPSRFRSVAASPPPARARSASREARPCGLNRNMSGSNTGAHVTRKRGACGRLFLVT